jgi:hypothetical protein
MSDIENEYEDEETECYQDDDIIRKPLIDDEIEPDYLDDDDIVEDESDFIIE